MTITSEELAAMRARLSDRQEQRKQHYEDLEVIGLVQRRPFEEAREEVTAEAAEEPAGANTLAQIASVAAWSVCELVMTRTTEDWLLVLTLAMIGFVAFGLRMA